MIDAAGEGDEVSTSVLVDTEAAAVRRRRRCPAAVKRLTAAEGTGGGRLGGRRRRLFPLADAAGPRAKE
jgi:hypothetical protein